MYVFVLFIIGMIRPSETLIIPESMFCLKISTALVFDYLFRINSVGHIRKPLGSFPLGLF